ncbi:MAG: 3'-5' exonuclease [Proteobacteria bacterium]|nr:3'-5' exonuclease [Pseudomonadota bacterium]
MLRAIRRYIKERTGPQPDSKHLDRPIDEVHYLVFDTALTGLKLKKDSIVSIGAVKMAGGKIEIGNTYYRLVAPRTDLTGQSVIIHGITPSEVSKEPDIDTLLPEFLGFCGNSIIVGHFISIDLGFINKEMMQLYGSPMKNQAVGTFILYQWIKQNEEEPCAYHESGQEDISLSALADKYGISVSSAHNALDDAYVTAQIFQRFISVLPGLGVRNLKDLLRIGKPLKSK